MFNQKGSNPLFNIYIMWEGIALLAVLFSSIVSMGMAKKDRDLQYERQNELLEKENQFNIDAEKRAREWNDENAQVDRMLSAGMSRGGALASLSGSTQNVISSGSTPSVAGLNPNLANLFSNNVDQVANLENIKADTRLKNAEASKSEEMLFFDKNLAQAQIDEIAKNMKMTDEEITNLQIINKYADQMELEKLKATHEAWKKTVQECNLLREEEKKAKFENYFRENFGIDIHDDASKQLVSAALKGTFDKVAEALEKEANKMIELAGNKIKDVTTGIFSNKDDKPKNKNSDKPGKKGSKKIIQDYTKYAEFYVKHGKRALNNN